MRDDKGRVWKILVEEIQTRKKMIKVWEKPLKGTVENVPQEIREKQVFGFKCELSALVGLGVKLFGMKHEELEAL